MFKTKKREKSSLFLEKFLVISTDGFTKITQTSVMWTTFSFLTRQEKQKLGLTNSSKNQRISGEKWEHNIEIRFMAIYIVIQVIYVFLLAFFKKNLKFPSCLDLRINYTVLVSNFILNSVTMKVNSVTMKV